MCAFCVATAVVAFVTHFVAKAMPIAGAPPRASASMQAHPLARSPAEAKALLGRLSAGLGPLLAESRKILLGRRELPDATCITQQLAGKRVLLQGSPNGGCGLRIMAFYAASPDEPIALYDWSQNQLRPFLQAEHTANAPVLAEALELAAAARQLASALRSDVPRPGAATGTPLPEAWPARCLDELRAAAEAGKAEDARMWAEELAAATFALADLHRWLDMLLGSHLTSLEFQSRCRTAYAWAQPAYQRTGASLEACLPAAHMTVAWGQNYLELERQAEGLFGLEDMAERSASRDPATAPAARWMPPELRQAFLTLRSCLSPPTQALLDRAAASPFERSYLANILFRASRSRTLDDLAVVLGRFERSHDKPTVPELMDVMFYRGGLYSSGFHWDDRYDPRIQAASGKIAGSAAQVAVRAHRVANHLLDGWRNYAGGVMTLKDALDAGKLDCVRGTDMIGALYRNAGHGGYCLLRLSCGTAGHSAGGVATPDDGGQKVLVLDSLSPGPPVGVWPAAYRHGMTWPEGYPGKRGPLFSVELCVRGLDGYVFAEGYVVRGPQAGQLLRAAVPYLPGRGEAGTAKLDPGPNPGAPPPVASVGLGGKS